jgi:6-phosphogluconolactonase
MMEGAWVFALSRNVRSIDDNSGELKSVKQYPMGNQPNWVEIVDRMMHG